MKDPVAKRLTLEELRRAFDKDYAASDILDGKLQNILNFLSVIVAIGPTVAGSALLDKIGWLFWLPVLAVLILYLISVRIIAKGLQPSQYLQPISNDWDELDRRYFNVSENDALNLIISEHLRSMELAHKQNVAKARAIQMATRLMRWIVILLLISIPIGLIFSVPTLPCFLQLASCGK